MPTQQKILPEAKNPVITDNNYYITDWVEALAGAKIENNRSVNLTYTQTYESLPNLLAQLDLESQAGDARLQLQRGKLNVIPYYQSEHFTLLLIDMRDEPVKMGYQNSLGNPISKPLKNLIEEFYTKKLGGSQDTFQANLIDYQQRQQTDGYECGRWVVENVAYFAQQSALPLKEDATLPTQLVTSRLSDANQLNISYEGKLTRKVEDAQAVVDDSNTADIEEIATTIEEPVTPFMESHQKTTQPVDNIGDYTYGQLLNEHGVHKNNLVRHRDNLIKGNALIAQLIGHVEGSVFDKYYNNITNSLHQNGEGLDTIETEINQILKSPK